jgi:hypothetical protein
MFLALCLQLIIMVNCIITTAHNKLGIHVYCIQTGVQLSHSLFTSTYDIFRDAVSNSDCTASNGWKTSEELERLWTEAVVAYLRQYPWLFMEELDRGKTLHQASLSLDYEI